nr:hypothetical protein GCM10020093_103890 [Planobispora longispora]
MLRLSASGSEISIGDLAQSAGVSSRNVTGLVDTLEREGLVRRTPALHDRRSVLAAITPAGQEWIENFRRPTQAAMAALFRGSPQPNCTSCATSACAWPTTRTSSPSI